MRNGRLRQAESGLDVRGAEPDFLVDGARPAFFECFKDLASRRVGDGVEIAIQNLVGDHASSMNRDIDECQCDWKRAISG